MNRGGDGWGVVSIPIVSVDSCCLFSTSIQPPQPPMQTINLWTVTKRTTEIQTIYLLIGLWWVERRPWWWRPYLVIVRKRGPFLIADALVAVERVVDAVAALWSRIWWRPFERLRLGKITESIYEVAFLDDLVSRVATDRPTGKRFTGRPTKRTPLYLGSRYTGYARMTKTLIGKYYSTSFKFMFSHVDIYKVLILCQWN